MEQSSLLLLIKTPLHVAIIMDGNGRWATARGLPRPAGHQAGAVAVRRTVEAAARRTDIGTLTLYAFSADNWRRPAREVSLLMRLMRRYLLTETARCVEHGVRVSVIGRRDRLAPALRRAIETAEAATANGRALHLRLAVDYSARAAILRAAQSFNGHANAVDDKDATHCVGHSAAAPPDEADAARARFALLLGAAQHDPASAATATDVDLIIRTGGEQRLSDFLLWESAYAELYFTRRMWPDFGSDG